jgi:SAM-dependent methyltransferase
MAVSRDEAENCYRYILGRAPESAAALAAAMAERDVFALRRRLLESEEFRASHAALLDTADSAPMAPVSVAPAAPQIELAASPAELRELAARLARSWEHFGATDPYWSVLTRERFRGLAPDEAFFASSALDLALLRALIARNAPDFRTERAVCLEYGCGVGRVTWRLAGMFRRVVACDVSRHHLDRCRDLLAARGIANVALEPIVPPALMPFGRFDLWFSRLVLQHNPPPLIARILERALAALNPGGLAVFQVPTDQEGYRFCLAAYLARRDGPAMEMHVLPQAAVFRIARDGGTDVLEVCADDCAGARTRSNAFILRKRRR